MSRIETQDAILFFGTSTRIVKQMMYMEFEAVLDGVVGLEDFANQTIRAVYVEVNGFLEMESCVTFTVSFDELGNADPSWNIPLRRIAYQSSQMESIRGYDIRTYTKNINTHASYQNYLWDFQDLAEPSAVLEWVAKAIDLNTLGLLGEKRQQESASAVAQEDANLLQERPALEPASQASSTPPAATDSSSAGVEAQSAEKMLGMMDLMLKKQLGELLSSTQQVQPEPPPPPSEKVDVEAIEKKFIEKYAQKLKQYKVSSERLIAEFQIQIERLKGLLKSTLVEKELYQKQATELGEEVKHLRGIIEERLPQMKRKHLHEVQELKEKQKRSLEALKARYSSDQAGLSESMAKEMSDKDETVHKLSEELCELRRDKMRLMMNGTDDFFGKLAESGLKMVAYQPGAGHLTIPLDDLNAYITDTDNYVAEQCGVSAETYTAWKAHTERPKCGFELNAESCCDTQIVTVVDPKQFVIGVSDRCLQHRSTVSIARMVNESQERGIDLSQELPKSGSSLDPKPLDPRASSG